MSKAILFTLLICLSLGLSAQDLLYTINEKVYEVRIIEVNPPSNRVSFLSWDDQKGAMMSLKANQVHKIKYAYGVEQVLTPVDQLNRDGGDEISDLNNRVKAKVPAVASPTLVFIDESDMQLRHFVWTKEGIEFHGMTGNQELLTVDLENVKTLVLPSERQLMQGGSLNRGAGQPSANQFGSVRLRTGLHYAAEKIIISDRYVQFNEFYTKQPFRWEVDDIDRVYWGAGKGSVDFVDNEKLNELAISDTEDLLRSQDQTGTTDISDLFDPTARQTSGRQTAAKKEISGSPSELPTPVWPPVEPTSYADYEVLPGFNPFKKGGWSLFPDRKMRYTLGSAQKKLSLALIDKGYNDLLYFPLEDGFMVMTAMEQFNADGSPATWATRRQTQASVNPDLSFGETLDEITFKRQGQYRFFAIMVTQEELSYPNNLDGEALIATQQLSPALSQQELTNDHKMYFMVYEWSQRRQGQAAEFQARGASDLSASLYFDQGLKASLNQ
ncbi:MAG: hypothetical protein AAFV78_01225 [Bacteroidota bacterium]